MSYQHPPLVRRVLESLVPVVCPPEAMELGLGADIVDHVALTILNEILFGGRSSPASCSSERRIRVARLNRSPAGNWRT